MSASLTLHDFFTLLIFILSIGALIYVIMFLSKVNKIFGQLSELFESNKDEMDRTIKELPDIAFNVKEISKETNYAIKTLTPEVDGVLRNANNITQKASEIADTLEEGTDKINDTVNGFSNSVLGIANNFESNSKQLSSYVNSFLDIMDTFKDIFIK